MPRRSSPPAPSMPNRIAVLPLRDQVLFPHATGIIHVARKISRHAIESAIEADRLVLAVAQRDMSTEAPELADLHPVGTICEILHENTLPDGTMRVALRGIARARFEQAAIEHDTIVATPAAFPTVTESDKGISAAARSVRDLFASVARKHSMIPPESIATIMHLNAPDALADQVAYLLPVPPGDKQALLETPSAKARLESILAHLAGEAEILRLEHELRTKVEHDISQSQRDYLLREQLRHIQRELDSRDSRRSILEIYREQIEGLAVEESTRRILRSSLEQLEYSSPGNPEHVVARTYLDIALSVPWGQYLDQVLDPSRVLDELNKAHYGLHRVKQRIAEHIQIQRRLANKTGNLRKGFALLFVGPPGVGKTSVARSLATATGRPLSVAALGGVRDEAEIRGHRRTYVGATAGRIVNALRESGAMNPVIVLDEIDKMSVGNTGDPSAALLELLDPVQQRQFVDHYLDLPIDLSAVQFIATANSIDRLSPALLDRFEVIPFEGYTEGEKVDIATGYLWPNLLRETGFEPSDLPLDQDLLREVIRYYVRESGVRGLARELATLARRAAMVDEQEYPLTLNRDRLEQWLGKPIYLPNSTVSSPGLATGLVVAPYGGDTVRIEVAITGIAGDRPALTLTGSMGTVMQESAFAALTWTRMQLDREGVDWKKDVHVHISNAGTPKDGPSAGIAIAAAMLSAFNRVALPDRMALTGEIGLTGRIDPVGGIREKCLAALRSGISTVICPFANRREVDELEPEITQGVRIVLVESMSEVLEELENQSASHAQTVSIL